ncbi:Mediator of RNA polymerase II transcription subunit 4 [Trichinella zimbabwensis]|uniref:Mediator of RNA polymerase II transcription subunit 4 n=1 Tax=Trichinella zimbabwensis TaxID=268475 RepID=A0A0V1H8G9_9BILA|nr:Mediator of RNA polymerase II transcription subunit 4 [Trichinella zimbabwensis]
MNYSTNEDESESVRRQVLDVIDDLELICRQVSEILTVSKESRPHHGDFKLSDLIELFKVKEDRLEELLKVAKTQTERQRLIDALESEIAVRDEYIERLRNCLIESESTLTNAIFQANLKLKSIAQSEMRKVSPEEVIRYAHRISAAYSVSAPLNWQVGDIERPFPLDIEMRSGWLARVTGSADYVSPAVAATPFGTGAASMPHLSGVDNLHSSESVAHMMAPSKLGWPSPRSAASQLISPKNRLPVPPSPNIPSSLVGRGAASIRQPIRESSPITTTGSPLVKRDTATAAAAAAVATPSSSSVVVVDDVVEAMSSDSSSSSSSDSVG